MPSRANGFVLTKTSIASQDSGVSYVMFIVDHLNADFVQNIYYRRTRRLDVPLVVELKLLSDGQSPTSTEDWTRIPRSIRDGVSGEPPLYLWYRTGKTVRDMTAQEKQENLITELDVLYGADRPWYGFEKLEPSVTLELGRVSSEWLTYRKGVKRMSAVC